jgi:branched-chain amino acid transport system permease protein
MTSLKLLLISCSFRDHRRFGRNSFSPLRLKGFYLAMATIAAQFIITSFFLHFYKPEVLGGVKFLSGVTLNPIQLGTITFNTQENLYYLIMPCTVIMTFFARNLVRSRLGRAFVAIRDNDLAAEIMGISLFHYKLKAFFIGCFFAGISGAIYIAFMRIIRPDQYTLMDSIWILGILIIGGLGSHLGPIFGVIFVKLLDEVALLFAPALGKMLPADLSSRIGASMGLSSLGLWLFFLILEPRGIAHRWEILKGVLDIIIYLDKKIKTKKEVGEKINRRFKKEGGRHETSFLGCIMGVSHLYSYFFKFDLRSNSR